jgi:alcohol dehydrogenase (cytochrome c)
MLENPDPADWLMWRRTLDSHGFSPLSQITRDNVESLRLVWVRPLNDGLQEGTPLVHDGILYFPEPGDVITAIDAASGVVIWQYRRELPGDIDDFVIYSSVGRNLAVYENLLIDTSADNFVYALDKDTGELVWETKVIDYRTRTKQSSGPLIADGLAITGRSCMPSGGPDACFIVAHDAKTGKEVWRTSTIARGDDPNSDSWGDVPEDQRHHVGAWMVPSYDPELGLVYMGTSVTAPAPKYALGGTDKQHLYHNSTLALDVKTGDIVWYYQHLIDHWDIDHPFERILLDTRVAPDPEEVAWINPDIDADRTYRVVTGIPGKTGIVYTLDRTNGEFLWARPTVQQTLVESIDGETGAVTGNPATVFEEAGVPVTICPTSSGGKNWMAGAYSPLTDAMYMPLQNTCATVTAVEDSGGTFGLYGLSTRNTLRPGTTDLGSIHAVSATTGKTLWVHEQRAGMLSLLTTAGGLVFAADADGRFKALDDSTGEVLWEVNLGSSLTGFPASFGVDGNQYVAVSSGVWTDDVYTPELTHGTQNTLFVFALPEAGTGRPGPQREPVVIPGGAEVHGAHAHPDAGKRPLNGAFSAVQAARGASVYGKNCVQCHGPDLVGGPGIPPIRGAAFFAGWQGRALSEFYAYLRTAMPPGRSGSLSEQAYIDVIAYLLERNGLAAGNDALPADVYELEAYGISRP